jgi:hypothetical protein
MKIKILRTRIGLGDAVHAVAQPAARLIDRSLGTSLAKCQGCAQRREKLNTLANNINPLARRDNNDTG